MAAFPCQSLERVAGAFQVGDPDAKSFDPRLGKLPRTAAVLTGIQLQQLFDFFEGEASGLSLFDEA